MDYKDILDFIESLSYKNSKNGLENIKSILENLGNPQDKIKVIHIAGTNGKGSCSCFIYNVLKEAGYKTALYTSPHLDKYNERFIIDEECISDKNFVFTAEKVKNACKNVTPTVFEFLTAMGYLYFYENNVDFAVIETGVGGILDATNVVKAPLISVITSIGYDHTGTLGNTIAEIAQAKGGIIKKDCPCVLYTQKNQVYEVIKNIADSKNSKLYYGFNEEISVEAQDLNGTIFSIKNDYINYPRVEIKMLGDFQINNCAVVLLAFKALEDLGIKVQNNVILNGIKKCFWNGRMEFFKGSPDILIDGSHNPDGINMLSKSLEKYFEGKKITLLMGVMQDKEYKKMLDCIIPKVENVIITKPVSFRALEIEQFKNTIAVYSKNIYEYEDVKSALLKALNTAGKNGLVCCCGSLYLVGEVRKYLQDML